MPPNAAPKGTSRTIYASFAREIAAELVLSPDEGPDKHLAHLIEKIGLVRGDVSAVTLGDVRAVLGRANQLSGERPAILDPLRDFKDTALIRDLLSQVFGQSDNGHEETASQDGPDDTEALPAATQREVDAIKPLVLPILKVNPTSADIVAACRTVCIQEGKRDPQFAMYVVDAVFSELKRRLSVTDLADLMLLKELGKQLS